MCASNVQSCHTFSRENGIFSRIWALTCEDRQTYARLLLQGKRRPHITLSYDIRGRRVHHHRLSWRYAPLTLQEMFRCGRPAAIHFLWSTERAAEIASVEEEQRREVEQHPIHANETEESRKQMPTKNQSSCEDYDQSSLK